MLMSVVKFYGSRKLGVMDQMLNDKVIVVAAFLRSSAALDYLRQDTSVDGRIEVRPTFADHFDLGRLKALRGDVLLVEVDFTHPAETRLLEEFVASGPASPIIVTSSHFDVESMRALMKIGILEVLPQPISMIDLSKAVDVALRERRPTPAVDSDKKGKVVSFLKSSGGVGATSLAVQGACAIARGAKPAKPILLDFDIQFGMAAILMDTAPRSSILDLIRDPKRLDGELLQRATIRPHDRFDLLAAPANILPVRDIDATAVAATIATARQVYEQVLIDLPLLWDNWVCTVLEASDLLVLVLRLTVPSLRQARHQLDMLRTEKLGHLPVFVVANAVDTGLFGANGVPLKLAEKALGRRIDFCVPKNSAMGAAADTGQPLNQVSGGKSLEAKLSKMMAGIFQRIQDVKSGVTAT